MYDTEESVARRLLAMILWVVVIVAVVWAVVWFVFFRNHAPQKSTGSLTHKNTTSQTQPQTPKAPAGSSSPTSNAATSAGSTLSGNQTTQAPTQLANTGAGDVFVPFTLAALAGSTVYYIRLRKKLVQQR